ncbi:MAG: hypothetical protein HC810_05220 [Acaryochloridaceae cyanobacterium RL_2_7]|nr:hypothetical protein [Acaryochloridaceae cyanobacterium RL_2_7]
MRTQLYFDICEGDQIKLDSLSIDTSGTYLFNYKAAGGCDSILTAKVTLNFNASQIKDTLLCEGEVISILGKDYSAKGDSLSGRLLVFNALEMKFRELRLTKNPDRAEITSLIDYNQFCNGSHPEPLKQKPGDMEEMTVQQLQTILESQTEEHLLIDVRNPNEYEIAQIPGSVLIPLSEIESGEGIVKIKIFWERRN